MALLAAIGYPIARFLSPPKVPEAATGQMQVGPTNDPEFLGKGYKIVPLGGEPIIVIRLSEKEFRAFTATCTHLACIVEFRKHERDIWCNCHNGEYDLHGRNIAGPPPRPLTPLQVHLVSKGAGQPETVVISKA